MAVACAAAAGIDLFLFGVSFAQAPAAGPNGRELYDRYCTACHGTTAKGDGPLASSMDRRPADLTRIAQRNAGTFPTEQVAQIVDGRKPVKGHGGKDMPAWGETLGKSSTDSVPVEEKIRRIVAYLESLQLQP